MGDVFIAVMCFGFAALLLFYGPIVLAVAAWGAARAADADSRLLEAKNEARRLALEERKARRAALTDRGQGEVDDA